MLLLESFDFVRLDGSVGLIMGLFFFIILSLEVLFGIILE